MRFMADIARMQRAYAMIRGKELPTTFPDSYTLPDVVDIHIHVGQGLTNPLDLAKRATRAELRAFGFQDDLSVRRSGQHRQSGDGRDLREQRNGSDTLLRRLCSGDARGAECGGSRALASQGRRGDSPCDNPAAIIGLNS